MSEHKHTPGPWRVDTWNGWLLSSEDVGIVKFDINRTLLADAKLIAEAPEMLRCLRGLMDSIEAYTAFHKPQQEWDEYDYMMIPRWQAAKALLEKIV